MIFNSNHIYTLVYTIPNQLRLLTSPTSNSRPCFSQPAAAALVSPRKQQQPPRFPSQAAAVASFPSQAAARAAFSSPNSSGQHLGHHLLRVCCSHDRQPAPPLLL